MLDFIDKIRGFLKGKKTYLVALLAIATALLSWAGGDITTFEMIKAIWTAIGAITIRAGVAS